ncbi:hypothetical protein VOLCADRAFT_103188 [Volvox carteri f. nagariensis]|uniref:Leucine-rich repeat-containing protein 51 n=1 Tax=Volvox carteri f. nagariensis TaxID=3068 RepID=D8TK22_VOLCA|nr:uncharacterized protein VOLCADRAFT_103188 [Volvox carteri f. nagariensis]EFJ52172.1 hypothetical protein VOLCADRAFT_103188 [Volvox carteri f. nagariensis]|eukprot:XP_002946946.1 hypothetical protein VOLCADRAFT_103188 [Volvox carteri f. nagariensis]
MPPTIAEEASTATAGRHRAEWLTVSITEQKTLTAGPPIDYSFKDLKSVLDLVMVEPTSGNAHKPALPPDGNPLEYLEALAAQDQPLADSDSLGIGAVTASPLLAPGTAAGTAAAAGGTPTAGNSGKQLLPAQRSSVTHPAATNTVAALGAKLNSNSLRLCNNHLVSLNGLNRVMRHVLEDPSQLVWLDVSSNQLSTIEDAVLEFPSLQVLYYHGNNITNINDVLKLQALPKLNKLTLHGNPIAETKNYKNWVVAHLPNLRNMDFGTITKVERDKIETWFKFTKKK